MLARRSVCRGQRVGRPGQRAPGPSDQRVAFP